VGFHCLNIEVYAVLVLLGVGFYCLETRKERGILFWWFLAKSQSLPIYIYIPARSQCRIHLVFILALLASERSWSFYGLAMVV